MSDVPRALTWLLAAALNTALGCGGDVQPVSHPSVRIDDAGPGPSQPVATDLGSTDLSPYQAQLPAPPADAAPPQPDATPASPCAAEETFFAGSCYSAPGLKWMSFDVAQQICAARNAEVASIDSPAVNQFVFGLLPLLNQQAWIGLRREAGAFGWLDGQPVGFQTWAPGEPNNEAGTEDCVVMWGPNLKSHPDWQGKWNDTACDTDVDTVICRRVP